MEEVRALRGMYAFLLWDDIKTGIFMARDPFGIGARCGPQRWFHGLTAPGRLPAIEQPCRRHLPIGQAQEIGRGGPRCLDRKEFLEQTGEGGAEVILRLHAEKRPRLQGDAEVIEVGGIVDRHVAAGDQDAQAVPP